MIGHIMLLDEKQVTETLHEILREFARRHRNITQTFYKHCKEIKGLIEELGINYNGLSDERKMLIGSYCTMEYAIESSALFNPSIVEDLISPILKLEKNESSYPSVPLGRAYLIHYFLEEQS
jgi:hypothetical protein